MSKCRYCNKIIPQNQDVCPACGATMPEESKSSNIRSWLVLICIVSIVIAIIFTGLNLLNRAFRHSNNIFTEESYKIDVQTIANEPKIADKYNDLLPVDVFKDAGLRQALELYFKKEIVNITWAQIETIKTIIIDRESVSFATVYVSTIDGVQDKSELQTVMCDERINEYGELIYFLNIESLAGAPLTENELVKFKNLKELSVHFRESFLNIGYFSNMPSLEKLYISGDDLTSLEGLSDLKKLNTLGLINTGLTDLSILSLQQNITSLKLIDTENFSSLNTLENMTWLKSLHIEDSEYIDLYFISKMTELESLTISDTETKTLDFIAPLTKLRDLTLTQNSEVLTMPSFSAFTQLETLIIDCGKVTDLSFLKALLSLKNLAIYGPNTLEPLRGFKDLERLTLQFGWLLTDISPLGELQNLKSLTITQSRTYEEVHGMSSIGNLKSLEYLNLESHENYFNADFIYELINLKELNLSNNLVVGDFNGIKKLQNLKILNLNNVSLVPFYRIDSSGGFVNIYWPDPTPVEKYGDAIGSLTNLEQLNIDSNDMKSISFVDSLKNLTKLSAKDNYIKDVSPISDLGSLKEVDLFNNPISNWETVDKMINTKFVGR